MNARTAPRRQALRRYRWVALYLPLGLVLVVAALQTLLIPDLSATVPTHFGADGTADGWGPAWTFPVLLVAAGGGSVLLIGLLGLLGLTEIGGSGKPAQLRWTAALAAAAGVLIAVLVGGMGSAPGRSLGVGTILAVGLVLAIGAGLLAYRCTVDVAGDGTRAEQPAPLPLVPGERVVWTGSTSMGTVGRAVSAVAVALAVISAVACGWAEISADGSAGPLTWSMIAVAVVVVMILLTTTSARIRVDAAGLVVRSPIGVPRIRIPAEQIRDVQVVDVNPMGEFGGWGWRWAAGTGGWGVVLRTGEGLRITRTDGRRFTVTADDAATAASLLAGLRSRG